MPVMKLHIAAGIMFTRQVVAAVIVMLTAILVAKLLSVADNGVYASLSLVPLMASNLASLGVGPSVVYQVSSKAFPVTDILVASFVVSVATSMLAVGLLIALWRFDFLPSIFNEFKQATTFAIFATIPLLVFTNIVSTLHGLQLFREFGLLSLLPPTAFFIGLIVLVVFYEPSVSLDNIIKLLFMAYSVSAITLLLYFRKELEVGVSHLARGLKCYKLLLGYGLKAYIGNVIGLLNYRLNYFFILTFAGSAQLGLFAVATMFCEGLWLVSSSTASVIFPRVASASDKSLAVAGVTLIAARLVLYITAAAALCLMPLIEIIVNTFLGSRYAEVNVIVYILTPGVLCMALARVLANEIAGRGFPAVNTKIAGLSLAVNVAANLILIPQYGVNGAAAAASIAYVTLSTLTVQAYSRIVGVSVGQIISPRVADIHTALRFVRSMFSAVPK